MAGRVACLPVLPSDPFAAIRLLRVKSLKKPEFAGGGLFRGGSLSNLSIRIPLPPLIAQCDVWASERGFWVGAPRP